MLLNYRLHTTSRLIPPLRHHITHPTRTTHTCTHTHKNAASPLPVLQKYSLTEFKPIIEGIRRGDLRTFNAGLDLHQDLFIRRGTYLLLEKCKTVCYRNLFKRVYLVGKNERKEKIPLRDMAKALQWLGKEMDMDEVECVLANLIFCGKVRGYISHEKRVLVLSKKDPFPTGVIIPK